MLVLFKLIGAAALVYKAVEVAVEIEEENSSYTAESKSRRNRWEIESAERELRIVELSIKSIQHDIDYFEGMGETQIFFESSRCSLSRRLREAEDTKSKLQDKLARLRQAS